jgi:hypothetical protein
VTPSWVGAGTAYVSVAINGRDFSGSFPFTFMEKLK